MQVKDKKEVSYFRPLKNFSQLIPLILFISKDSILRDLLWGNISPIISAPLEPIKLLSRIKILIPQWRGSLFSIEKSTGSFSKNNFISGLIPSQLKKL